jgi:hypothetical protein
MASIQYSFKILIGGYNENNVIDDKSKELKLLDDKLKNLKEKTSEDEISDKIERINLNLDEDDFELDDEKSDQEVSLVFNPSLSDESLVDKGRTGLVNLGNTVKYFKDFLSQVRNVTLR